VHELFGYDEAIIERFPTIRAGLVHASGLANGPSPSGLLDEYRTGQYSAVDRLATTPISDLPSVSAWRRAFTRFGVKPTQYRSAVESLLRRLEKQGEIPSISVLVDIGNLVSIRHGVPVAVFDRAGLAGALTVRFATGEEVFADLGSSESTHPEPGEVVFVDLDDVVAARRWCWRQSAGSASGLGTTEALFVIEAHHEGAEVDVDSATKDVTALLVAHQPGNRSVAHRLSPEHPRV
jgi:DNA/RNA-binding domain of Phe-tRNA-synthetase-like protein